MRYRRSNLDKKLSQKFAKDLSAQSLVRLELRKGRLRGLHKCDLAFKYPISAVCGRNGAGKSTVLALAACAYHNSRKAFNPLGRRVPYYTFSDFFVQSEEEVPPSGIDIWYKFRSDTWSNADPGDGYQRSRKRQGGRWSNYDRRVNRNVVYFGIERVVPHYERSVSKSYKRSFADSPDKGWEKHAQGHVERILGEKYDRFWIKSHRSYQLPMTNRGGNTVSGFNMGAGENALFGIFSTIYSTTKSLLLVIDEIELGLHEQAQAQLVNELKELCATRRLQIICTTHSPRVLEELPPEARFFVQRLRRRTRLIPEVSPAFAAGRLGGRPAAEVQVLVEDEVAVDVLNAALSQELRYRCDVLPVGSHAAVMRCMATKFLESSKRSPEVVALLDGDQRTNMASAVKTFLNAVENSTRQDEARKWIQARLGFLPGSTWPEYWLLDSCRAAALEDLALILAADEDELDAELGEALLAGKHREFDSLAVATGLSVEVLRASVARAVLSNLDDEREEVVGHIEDAIGD